MDFPLSHQWGFQWKSIKISVFNFKWINLGAQVDFGGVLELGYKYFNPSESIPHVSGAVGALQVLERNLLFLFSLIVRDPGLRASTL